MLPEAFRALPLSCDGYLQGVLSRALCAFTQQCAGEINSKPLGGPYPHMRADCVGKLSICGVGEQLVDFNSSLFTEL